MADIAGYFDYAAATPVDPKVLQAMQPFFGEKFYNPSAMYGPARQVKKVVGHARSEAAQVLGVKPAEIIFTAGGTEANNLAIAGIMQRFPDANLIISSIEHESVRKPAQHYQHQECPVTPQGFIDIEALKTLIGDKTVLVSVMYANNEIGTIQPIRKIADAVDEVKKKRRATGNTLPLYVHTDAAQATNYLSVNPHRLGVDLLSLNGGKIYGPKQTGILYIRGGLELKPLIVGGGQEKALRSGTENVPGIVGLAEALKVTAEIQDQEVTRLKELQKFFIKELAVKIPGASINGSVKHRLPNNVHVTIPGQDNERLLILLDEGGYYAAAGSACSASSDEPSHVLQAIGRNKAEIRASLRFTMGRFTTEKNIQGLVERLASLLA